MLALRGQEHPFSNYFKLSPPLLSESFATAEIFVSPLQHIWFLYERAFRFPCFFYGSFCCCPAGTFQQIFYNLHRNDNDQFYYKSLGPLRYLVLCIKHRVVEGGSEAMLNCLPSIHTNRFRKLFVSQSTFSLRGWKKNDTVSLA